MPSKKKQKKKKKIFRNQNHVMNIFNKDDNNKKKKKKKWGTQKSEKKKGTREERRRTLCTLYWKKCLRMSDNDPGAREHKTPRNLPQIFCTYKRTTRRRESIRKVEKRTDGNVLYACCYSLLIAPVPSI